MIIKMKNILIIFSGSNNETEITLKE